MMLVFWLLSTLLLVVYAAWWWYGRRARTLLQGLPCYPPLPIIGNCHQVFGNAQFLLVEVMGKITKSIDETGKPFVVWLGPLPFVVVADPEDVKAVSYAFVEKPYFYSFARDWVGNGLVTAPANIWKRSIKKLAGTFTGNIVEGYLGVFNAQAHKLMQQLRGEVGAAPFDVLHKYLAFTTLETICQTALGVPEISENIVTREYYRAFTRTFQLFVERGTNLFMHLDCIYKLTPAYRELHRCIATMQKVSNSVILSRLKEREEMKRNGTLPKNDPDSENGETRFKSFLEILFELRDLDPTMTMTQIKNEVDTIIVGGQDTVATTLFFTLVAIGSKSHVQDNIYNELKEIFGDSRRPVQKADLLRMSYIEAVIFETLRLFPPFPVTLREADHDLQLASCTIPKGAKCGISAWAAGRSTRIWGSDAAEYRPERWLETDLMRAKSASFLAFSYGKRACIGRRYAMVLIKTILAYVVREMEISSELEKLQMKADVSLKPISGHLITVRRRQL